MTDKEILIAYGTRFGSTEEVAHEIAKTLETKGLTIQLLNLKKVKEKEWPSIKSFKGIIVGSSIKMGRWMNEPENFLKKHAKVFKQREKVLGIFVSSGYAAIPEKTQQVRQEYLESILNELEIQADIYDGFGGVFDFSASSKMGFLDKKIARMAAKMAMKELGKEQAIKIDEKTKVDQRDWNQIRKFAEKFAEFLR